MPDSTPSPAPAARRPLDGPRRETLRLHDRTCAVLAFGSPFPQLDADTPRSDRASSRIYAPDTRSLVKVCMVQSRPKNQLLRLIGRSRAQIEADSNLALDALGLRTPRITAVACAINPLSSVDSALVAEKIPHARDGLAYLADDAVPAAHRLEFAHHIVDGITRMLEARLVLRDFRLSNILVEGDDPTPVWIDNELKHARSDASARARLRITVERMIRKNCGRLPAPYAAALVAPLNRLLA